MSTLVTPPSRSQWVLFNFIALLLFGFSLISVALVIERVIAATWSYYKFLGYSDQGYISLSIGTGLIFTVWSTVLVVASATASRLAARKHVSLASRLLGWSAAIAGIGLLGYLLLALSPLNEWSL